MASVSQLHLAERETAAAVERAAAAHSDMVTKRETALNNARSLRIHLANAERDVAAHDHALSVAQAAVDAAHAAHAAAELHLAEAQAAEATARVKRLRGQ